MVLNINQIIFRTVCFSGKQKLALKKGTVARDFLPLIFFFMNRLDSTAKYMTKIVEVKLSSCGFKVPDFRKNCD
jgi:hypothetical protein